jgi:hypothetical protein
MLPFIWAQLRYLSSIGPRGTQVAVYIQVTRLNAELGQVELVGGILLPSGSS